MLHDFGAKARSCLAALRRQRRDHHRRLESLVAALTAELACEKETAVCQTEKLDARGRSKLFAEISHELYAQLILISDVFRDVDGDRFGAFAPELRRQVGRICANAVMLLDQVEQILDTSQLEGANDAPFLERVTAVIDDNLSDENFGVDTLAVRLSASRSLLYLRLEELGQTPAGLIMERRLRRAAEMLAEGTEPVGNVASAVGFKSTSHFSQRFRERFGKTPSAYRRNSPEPAIGHIL